MPPLSAARTSGHDSPTGLSPIQASDTGSFRSVASIPADEVRTVIGNAWDALRRKSKEQLEACYFPTASVLVADARRSELARLMIARRDREFFGPSTSIHADLSSIDVQMAGSQAAFACYTFKFELVRQLPNGKCHEQTVPFLRATAVVRRDENGALKILHEHQSAVEFAEMKEIVSEETVAAR